MSQHFVQTTLLDALKSVFGSKYKTNLTKQPELNLKKIYLKNILILF